MSKDFDYPLYDTRIIDGDTVRCWLILSQQTYSIPIPESCYWEQDLGFRSWIYHHEDASYFLKILDCRIKGVDTPELRPRRSREAGRKVTECVMRWTLQCPLMYAKSYKMGAYNGRFIGDIWSQENQSLSEFLLQEKLAKPALDGRRQHWSDEDLQEVTERASIYLSDHDLFPALNKA